jgi:glutamine cyclotransferase
MLNELEFIDGYVYANVWMTTRIAVIEPATGVVVAWLDAAHLHPQPSNREMTLNGIAFDEDTRKLYVTGKLWPTLFEIQPYTPR